MFITNLRLSYVRRTYRLGPMYINPWAGHYWFFLFWLVIKILLKSGDHNWWDLVVSRLIILHIWKFLVFLKIRNNLNDLIAFLVIWTLTRLTCIIEWDLVLYGNMGCRVFKKMIQNFGWILFKKQFIMPVLSLFFAGIVVFTVNDLLYSELAWFWICVPSICWQLRTKFWKLKNHICQKVRSVLKSLNKNLSDDSLKPSKIKL